MSEAEIDYRLLEAIVLDVKTELLRATQKFNSFKSAHEGYAIIVEDWRKCGRKSNISHEIIERCVKKRFSSARWRYGFSLISVRSWALYE
jgi:hypothetical protein